MSVIQEINQHRQQIKTDQLSMSWKEVANLFRDGDIEISPDYQRLFRWSIEQQTKFIESIFLNIPIPPLFFAQNQDGKYEVIDGLQRISTMIKFFSSDLFDDQYLNNRRQYVKPTWESLCAALSPSLTLRETDFEIESVPDDNNIFIPTTLIKGELVQSLNGFTFKTLDESLRRTVSYARVDLLIIGKESPANVRFHVFNRLNTMGSSLSDQEIRNCSSRLLGKKFPDQLRALAHLKYFPKALGPKKGEGAREMEVEEFILRLLAFQFFADSYGSNIDAFLNDFMRFASEGKFVLNDSIQQKLIKTFQLISENYQNGDAFKWLASDGVFKGALSTNLFDIIATGVFSNVEKIDSKYLKEKIQSLHSSPELKELTGAGSNSKIKVLGRINFGKKWFQ